jgi:DNA-binding MarR family transcriptional regulator
MPFAPAVPFNSKAVPDVGGRVPLDAVVDAEAEAFRVAKALYTLRRRRDAATPVKGLFGEPAWDILLDLFIAYKRGTELQVSSVCLEAGVPSTTILRWIARLEREGLLYRQADTGDLRRRYVRLTQDGLTMMRNILGAIGTF